MQVLHIYETGLAKCHRCCSLLSDRWVSAYTSTMLTSMAYIQYRLEFL